MSNSARNLYWLAMIMKWLWTVGLLLYLGFTTSQRLLFDYLVLVLSTCFEVNAMYSVTTFSQEAVLAAFNTCAATMVINLLLLGVAPHETDTPYKLLQSGAVLAIVETLTLTCIRTHLHHEGLLS